MYTYGLEILGDIREVGALKKILSEKMVMHRMHAYDPEWQESDLYHAKLKTELEAAGVPKAVIDYILAGKK